MHWAAERENREAVRQAFAAVGIEGLEAILAAMYYMEGITRLGDSRTHSLNAYLALIATTYTSDKQVECEYVSYHKSDDPRDCYVIFVADFGDIRWYSTTKLAEAVGAGYARANQVHMWKELGRGMSLRIEPLIVHYSEKQRQSDGSTYYVATAVSKTDHLDDILEGRT